MASKSRLAVAVGLARHVRRLRNEAAGMVGNPLGGQYRLRKAERLRARMLWVLERISGEVYIAALRRR